MLIDILFLGMMLLAIFKGIRNGLIIAIFSVIGWILGLIAAFKFAGLAANFLEGSLNIGPRALYVISFFLVFMLVMLLVHLGAKLIEKAVELALMGWINRLGGIFFYVLLYTLIFSVLIYFAERIKLISEETIAASRIYPWIKPVVTFIRQPFLH